mmetsp:Transcript_4640/g.17719  ORF Transcript_4640/g.17719 Transcript_4640/m.17719 type:complete len:204 (-) Transcript_4640:146-757(-)
MISSSLLASNSSTIASSNSKSRIARLMRPSSPSSRNWRTNVRAKSYHAHACRMNNKAVMRSTKVEPCPPCSPDCLKISPPVNVAIVASKPYVSIFAYFSPAYGFATMWNTKKSCNIQFTVYPPMTALRLDTITMKIRMNFLANMTHSHHHADLTLIPLKSKPRRYCTIAESCSPTMSSPRASCSKPYGIPTIYSIAQTMTINK